MRPASEPVVENHDIALLDIADHAYGRFGGRSIEPRWTGSCLARATNCAVPSKIAQEVSMRSLMSGEKAVS